MFDPQVGDFLRACAGVVEKQQQGSVAQREPSLARQMTQQVVDLVDSRNRVSAGAARLVGMAAMRWQTASISGSRMAM